MHKWNSLYEILKYPMEVIFVAYLMLGICNLITNPVFGIVYLIDNNYVQAIAELTIRAAQFLIVNFPLLFLIRIAARKGGSATSITSAISGYVVYLCATMYFASTALPSTSYSSILGISISHSEIPQLASGTHYPLQTGVFGIAIISFIAVMSFNRSRNHSEYSAFSFVSKEAVCTIRTVFYSLLAGIAMAYLWPFAIYAVQKIVSFITVDTTNPVNLMLYGITDRLLSTFGLGTMIRQPFWFGNNGGSWINLAGASITGDVNVWTAQYASYAVKGMAGRFITPYYILNIFAIPGMVWGMFALSTDKNERRKLRLLCVIATLSSWLGGTLLPLELMLLFAAPLLLAFHLIYTGLLFAVLQSLHIYLGYRTTSTSLISALPGTLSELMSYVSHPDLMPTLMKIGIAGAISAVIYFAVTIFFFRHLGGDLFNTGENDRMVRGTIKAVGGVENIKQVQANISSLTISLYDPTMLNVNLIRKLGAFRVYETRNGFRICYGQSSTMIRLGIIKTVKESIRTVND